MSQARQLAAIMFTDIVGYTAMMQTDEQKAVAVIKHYNAVLEKLVSQYNGQILNYYGDGSLFVYYTKITLPEDYEDHPSLRKAFDKPELKKLFELRRKNIELKEWSRR